MVASAINAVNVALGTELNASGKFNSGTQALTIALQALDPTLVAGVRCYRSNLLSFGVGI